MNISLVTIIFPPEIGGAAHLIYELAASLTSKGHRVTVVTGYPRYNLKVVPPKYRRGLWMTETIDGISVVRIRMPSFPRSSKLARGIEHVVFGIWLTALAAFVPRPDVVMAYSPPLTLPWMIGLLGRLRRVPLVVNVQDLFPKEAVELGMLTNPALIRVFEAMERQTYRLASRVTVHSPGNKEHVVSHGGVGSRVEVVDNWVDLNRINPGPKDNDFSRPLGLNGRYVVSYAGTMGWGQDMGTIVRSAARLRDDDKILFLLVGDGVEKPKAQALSEEMGLTNVLWLPIQPWSLYPDILAASDVSMINLHPELHTPVVPSKLFSIMAAARPVIASLPVESDARRIVADADCGLCVPAGDDERLAGAIRTLAGDRALSEQMGRRGRSYAFEHFSREACTARFEAVMRSAIGGKR